MEEFQFWQKPTPAEPSSTAANEASVATAAPTFLHIHPETNTFEEMMMREKQL